jgi:hypothetical protein
MNSYWLVVRRPNVLVGLTGEVRAECIYVAQENSHSHGQTRNRRVR